MLTAKYNSTSYSCTLTVLPKAPNQLLLDATSIKAKTSVTGHVWLNAPAPPGGATVMLKSDHSLASVPAQVVIPEGWFHLDFTVSTKATTASSTTVKISASYGTTISTPLTVKR